MKLAITGCNGSVGRCVVRAALARGHDVLGIDIDSSLQIQEPTSNFGFLRLDLVDYTGIEGVLKEAKCDAVIHLAAAPNPGDYLVRTHNNNVVSSWNVLKACAELNITRIAQASSVNVITMVYSRDPHFYYFPIDEAHPCEPDEPYGLSKVVAELQATSLTRRYPSLTIASLRLHWSVPDLAYPRRVLLDETKSARDLWGYVQEESAAEAFLLAIEGPPKWRGHEAFFVAAPYTTSATSDSLTLKPRYWPEVPVREGWFEDEGPGMEKKGFFDCSKAQRMLGWMHRDTDEDKQWRLN